MTDQTTRDARAAVRDYKEIRAEYAFDPDIFSSEDERSRRVKWIIDNRLSTVDKIISPACRVLRCRCRGRWRR